LGWEQAEAMLGAPVSGQLAAASEAILGLGQAPSFELGPIRGQVANFSKIMSLTVKNIIKYEFLQVKYQI